MIKKKILVADDKPEIRESVVFILEENGYEIYQAANGDECLRKVAAYKPDLVITDVMMPGKSGYHFLQELRDLPEPINKTPLIVMSGKASVKDMFEGWRIEAFLVKPFGADQLLKAVSGVWKNEKKTKKTPAPAALPKTETAAQGQILLVTGEGFDMSAVRAALKPLGLACLQATDEATALSLLAQMKPRCLLIEATVKRAAVKPKDFCGKVDADAVLGKIPYVLFIDESVGIVDVPETRAHTVLKYDGAAAFLPALKQTLRGLGIVAG